MKEATKVLAVRLTRTDCQQLDERARKERLSRSEYVRKLVHEDLNGSWRQETLDRFADLEMQLVTLREAVAKATLALLCEAGADRQAAEEWVRDNLP